MKKLVLGVFGGALFGVLACGAVKSYVIDPKTVSTTDELLSVFYETRSSLPPLPSPLNYQDVMVQLSEGRADFIASPNWAFTHDGGTYYLAGDSKLAKKLSLPMKLLAYEDLASGKVVLAGIPAATEKLQGLAIVDAPAFASFDEKTSVEHYLLKELWPRRIIWSAELKPEADAWSDLVQGEPVMSMSVALMMMAMSGPEEITEFEVIQDGTNISVNLPPEFAGADITLERSANLVAGGWADVLQTNAACDGTMFLTHAVLSELPGEIIITTNTADVVDPITGETNYIAGTVTTNYVEENVPAFYRAHASSSVDTDGDGLDNVYEYSLGTEYQNVHSDNDGLEDGEEVVFKAYELETAVYEWVDIELPQNEVVPFTDDIDGYAEIALGFEYKFYTGNYSNVYVCNNGFLSFGTPSTDYSNESLPSSSAPDNLVAVFWDDFRQGAYTGATVYAATQGMNPNRRIVVTWKDFPFYNDHGARLTFQTIISEGGDIFCQYKSLIDGTDDYASGKSATVGVQNGEGTVGVMWSHNTPNVLTNGLAIKFAYSPRYILITHPGNWDTDGDLIDDGFESARTFLDPNNPYDAGLDEDGDSLSNLYEYQIGTHPDDWDTDGDQLSDKEVLFGLDPRNALPTDMMPDSDGDGMTNRYEVVNLLDPFDDSDKHDDRDSDGLDNYFEYQNGLLAGNDDTDGDGLLDGGEYHDPALDPLDPDPAELLLDSDGDGLSNGYEASNAENPFETDYDVDEDGLSNTNELAGGTSPVLQDTEGDSLFDGWELAFGYNPNGTNNPALDNEADGFGLFSECMHGCDPNNPDSDGDGIVDGEDPYPSGFKPEIIMISPGVSSIVDTVTATVEGEVVFSGNPLSVKVDGLDADVSQSGTNWLFTYEKTFSRNGFYDIEILLSGKKYGAVLKNVYNLYFEVNAVGPSLEFLSHSESQVINSLYSHVTVLTDMDEPVYLDGQLMARDGFMNYAWVELSPGTNTLTATSTSSAGRLTTVVVSVVCDVAPGHDEDPPADRDQDGVPDIRDWAPDDPTVTGAIQVDSPPNGIQLIVK